MENITIKRLISLLFVIAEKVAIPFILVTVDIKPGSFPNTINLGSRGTVPVAILGSPTFDVTTVNPVSVTLAGSPVKLNKQGSPMAAFEDVNSDGILDLVVHVITEALHLNKIDTEAHLNAVTFDNIPIRGVDTVRIIPKK